jgi:hypothetical protein
VKFIQKTHITDWPVDYLLVCGNVTALRQDAAANHNRTYTAQDAITLIGAYGHWGPWN